MNGMIEIRITQRSTKKDPQYFFDLKPHRSPTKIRYLLFLFLKLGIKLLPLLRH